MIPHNTLTAASGVPCPQSGIWESVGNFKTTVTLYKGEPMPDYCGLKTFWKLLLPC